MIPGRFNLADYCVGQAAQAVPGKAALLVVDDVDRPETAERWTYQALDLAVRRIAGGLLAEGLLPGERILLRLPNCSDVALVFLGAIAAGLVPVPTSPQLTAADSAFLLADAAAAAVVHGGGVPLGQVPARCKVLGEAELARLKAATPLPSYAATMAEAPAFMIYTSGTSAQPKGVVHAQRTVIGRVPMQREWQGLSAADVMLHAGAFNWSFTLGVGLLDPWSAGATAVLYTGPKDIAMWPRLIDAVGATLFAAVPSLYRQILKYCLLEPGCLATLRHGLAAGEALAPAVLEDWRRATGKELYEAFGMSECSTFVSNGAGRPIRPGSPGKPQGGRPIAILPVDGGTTPAAAGSAGLLSIGRGDAGLMLGYWNRPEAEEQAFRGDWFVSGDLAVFDDDGYLWHRGRADEVLNAGGYRVSPRDVESALSACPGVAEVAVAEYRPRPDVTVLAAFVVRAEGCAVTADEILAAAAERLAGYKRPKQLFFVRSLPRSANGKLLRRALPGLAETAEATPQAPMSAPPS